LPHALNSSASKNNQYNFDAIIIGTGPGGEGAAMNLAKQQKNVALPQVQC